MCDLIMHPEYEKVYNEVKTLNSEIADLFEERDELYFHICKNIESEYMLKIGALEYKAYEFQCKVLRIKRKIELIQAKLNRQEIVFVSQIEEQLDAEYREYEENLKKQMESIDNALDRINGEKLSEKDNAELKKEYRRIIKKLHPDINENLSEEEKKLFLKAVSAYENGDLKTIRTIALLIEEISYSEKDLLNGLDELKTKRDSLIKVRNDVILQIEKIKASFPYNQKGFLEDEKKVDDRQKELNMVIDRYRELYQDYEERLNELLGGEKNG